MPKEALNIIDFSGGFNNFNDKRDIAENEVVLNNNLVSNGSGSLELAYGFLPVLGMDDVKGWENGGSLNNTSYFQPANHFVIYGTGQATSSSSKTVLVICDTPHGLSVNTPICIVKSGSDNTYRGNIYPVNSVDGVNFTITIVDAASLDENWTWMIGGHVEGNIGITPGQVIANTTNNNLILQNNGFGRFGFFNIDNQYFYGDDWASSNSYNNDPWLFDTVHLWDFYQSAITHVPDSSLDIIPDADYHPENTFYIDGVFRILERHPKYFAKNHLRRPTGLYYIPEHKKFGSSVGTNQAKMYASGWYPLRTHCLSPDQLQANINTVGTSIVDTQQQHGIISATTDSSMVPSELAGDMLDPSNADISNMSCYFVNVGVGTSTNEGDYDFSGKFSKIGLGISFVYDDINQSLGSFSQESNISPLTSNGTDTGNNYVSMPSNGLKALNLTVKVNKGNFASTPLVESLYSSSDIGVPQSRGSNVNGGYSNIAAWNPRIVGINVYITRDNLEVYDSPLLLAKFNLYGDENIHGISTSADGVNAQSWVNTDGSNIAYQTILDIEAVPVESYYIKNLYRHNENIHAWYKTSAIVNRRLYAGNVSYFSETNYKNIWGLNSLDNQEGDTLIEHYPDKILRSVDINKFDVLPASSPIEIAKFDGQEIISLLAFNDQLLIFKTNDLFVLDCSGETDSLKATLFGKGLKSKHHAVRAGDFVFFMNESGLYVYDGNTAVNVLTQKIRHAKWKQIFNASSQVTYDSNYGLVIIVTSYDPSLEQASTVASNCLYYNVAANAFYFKNKDTIYGPPQINKAFQVSGDLYSIASEYNTGLERLNITTETEYVAGVKYEKHIKIKTAATGTWPGLGGGTALSGQLSTDVEHIKIKKASDNNWHTLNTMPYWANTAVHGGAGKIPSIAGKLAEFNAEALADVINNQDTNTEYSVFASAIPREEDAGSSEGGELNIAVIAKKPGTDSNGAEQDLSSTVHANYGTTSVAFGANTTNGNYTAAGLSIGNITSYEEISTTDGVNRVNPEYRISPDRLGNRVNGTVYNLQVVTTDENNNHTLLNYKYIIGVDYFSQSQYNYNLATMTSSDDNANNDNLCANIRQALLEDKIYDPEQPDHLFTNLFNISTISGSSGSKYFDITLKDEVMNVFTIYVTYQVSLSATPNATLLKWNNESVTDAYNTFYSKSRVELETKDYDFGQPSVRKKVYKAYITYTGGDGEIVCYYQANQSGSFTKCTVLDSDGATSTNANKLNNSANQTRAELRFGTGGNNIYSFALKFVSANNVSNFKVNDISLVYRIKKPK